MAETGSSLTLNRSIARGLKVLRILSLRGPMNLATITKETGLSYATVCRIVNTLLAEAYIEREPSRKHFRVTGLVKSLSHGYQQDNQMVKVAHKYLVELTKELEWVVVLATRLGSSMVAQDSTHMLTTRTFIHYYPGFTFPILDSAAGRAYLAFCSEEERVSCLNGIEQIEGKAAEHAVEVARTTDELEQIRKIGFATRGRNPSHAPSRKNSSIAVPIFDGEEVCGALCLVFFSAAMPIDEAVARYAPRLMQTAKTIGEELTSSDDQQRLEHPAPN